MELDNHYKIVIEFTTDRKLTEDELDHLVIASTVQVEDPADYTGESKRASFTTHTVTSSALHSNMRIVNGGAVV
jgi:hypothetical protein